MILNHFKATRKLGRSRSANLDEKRKGEEGENEEENNEKRYKECVTLFPMWKKKRWRI